MSFCDLKDELDCAICLSIYTDPVTLRCGHSFCYLCIQQVLDSQESSAAYSCPECRKRFKSRPAPLRNTTLCNIVKCFTAVSPKQSIENIFCTYCIERPVRAAKSCLLCEASLCTDHLTVHSKSPEHVLVEPTTSSHRNRKCTVHSKVLDYFNPEDATCVYCAAHRNQTWRQPELLENQNMKEVLKKLIFKRKTIIDHIQSLQLHKGEVQKTADRFASDTRALFGELKRILSALEKRIQSEILRQEEQVSSSVDNIIGNLEVKKNDLSQQIACVEEICNFPVLKSKTDDFSDIEEEATNIEHQIAEEKFYVDDFIPILISKTLERELRNILTDAKPLYVGSEALDLSLDGKTAGQDLVVSGDQKTVSWSRIKRKRSRNSERFQACSQILTTRRFSPGKYYWEIETSDFGTWRIGVAYESINRINLKARIGDNKKSWCLCRYKEEYSVRHDDKKTKLSRKVLAPRVGVYLDSWVGTLSFFELGDPIEQLYTFTSTFSEPLYAVFYLGGMGWLRILGTG